MLLSTLPELPGRHFEVRGFVYASSILAGFGILGGGSSGGGGAGMNGMVQAMIQQAAGFGADGIVDIKTVIGGEHAYVVMTGTAVKL